MEAKPRVQRLARAVGNRADVIMVSIHSEVGRNLTERYDFEFSPLFILFDANGVEVWRGADVPSQRRVLSATVEYE